MIIQNTFPVLRLEFESMKHSIKVAMAERMVTLDKDIQDAIDKYCTAENLSTLIDQQVKESVVLAVKEEIRRQFQYSEAGRLAIREAITEHMDHYFGERKELT